MDKRTASQNRAMHKFFELLAKELNETGYDMKRTLKPSVDIPWTPQTIKTFLWKPMQDAMLEKESTTELTRKEVNQVHEVLARHLGEKLGITVPAFPSINSMIDYE